VTTGFIRFFLWHRNDDTVLRADILMDKWCLTAFGNAPDRVGGKKEFDVHAGRYTTEGNGRDSDNSSDTGRPFINRRNACLTS
jgi:hypothetical protein